MTTKKKNAQEKKAVARERRRIAASEKPRCGLCGKTRKLTQAPCCGNWICDDEEKYVLFSYATNSCSRNHRRYTLCAYHHTEGHAEDWRECERCRKGFDTETYVWFGTNEHNFVKLSNPPTFEPTKCSTCGAVIDRGTEAYSQRGDACWCEACTIKELGRSASER